MKKIIIQNIEWKNKKNNFLFQIFTYLKFNFIKILFLFLLSISISAKETGVCYQWSEGDAQHLDSCEVSSLEDCSKGRKAISKKETAFQNYTGKLFLDKDNQNIYEFKKGNALDCEKEIIKSAREAELTMCSNWGKAVYSTGLKVGDKAFIYGKSVNVREKANSKSKKLFSPEDKAEVNILEKSVTEDKIDNLYSAFWFKISVNGKVGWVYGQFIHPDPKSKNEFIE